MRERESRNEDPKLKRWERVKVGVWKGMKQRQEWVKELSLS